MQDDTATLTERAAAGDRQAIELLLERHLPGLRAFVRLRVGPMLRGRESSSDLVQSVCREVIEHIDRLQYPSESAFRRWLFATALRKIQHRRVFYQADKRDVGRERPPAAPDASRSDSRVLECYSRFSSPSRHAIVKEEIERIERAFDQLPDEYREVITQAHVVGLSRAEIAAEMNKTEGAVRMLLHRALAQISMLLDRPLENR